MKPIILLCLSVCLATPLRAGSRTSASYVIASDVVDGGGRRSASLTYTNIGSAGGASGLSAAALPSVTVRSGYAGQLFEIIGFALTAAAGSVGEGGSCQLAAWQALDDATFLAVPAASVAWSVAQGPLTAVSGFGLATAGLVYQDTPATVVGVLAGQTGTCRFTVMNVNPDDFGAFAQDGFDDAIQVNAAALAAPNADADGDGKNNILEYAFGTDIMAADSGVLTLSGPAVVQRGLPATWAQNIGNAVDFRAIFGRRKDYAAAGLTFTVQFSADLVTWRDSTVIPTVIASDTVIDAVSVPYPLFINGRKARFFRVQVSKP